MRTAAAVVGCWMPFFDFFFEKNNKKISVLG
jgi:hypothetical protein